MDRSARSRHRTALQVLLREIRREKFLRQVDVADALGTPQSFVSKYESGERRLDLVELQHVAAALDISLQELIRRYIDATH